MPTLETEPRIAVSAIYRSIVGEGALMGRAAVIVRTGGCDYRCRWCDNLQAVLSAHKKEWVDMTAAEVFECVRSLMPRGGLVYITGGNPALQPLGGLVGNGLGPLVGTPVAAGYKFALETQGSVYKPWFSVLDYLVLSPKPPSSGMEMKWAKLANCINGSPHSTPEDVTFNIPVFDDEDYAWARSVHDWVPWIPMVLTVGNAQANVPEAEPSGYLLERWRWLADKVMADNWGNVKVQPQLNVLMYGRTGTASLLHASRQ